MKEKKQEIQKETGIQKGQGSKTEKRTQKKQNRIAGWKKRFFEQIIYYQEREPKRGCLIAYVLFPLFLTFLFECLGYRSLFGGIIFLVKHPFPFLCNYLIVTSCLMLTLFMKRRAGGIILISTIWTIGALTNFIVLCFRVTPFTGNDLVLIQDAVKVIPKYMNMLQIILLAVLIGTVFLMIMTLCLIVPKVRRRFPILKSIAAAAAVWAVTAGSILLGWKTGLLDSRFTQLSEAFKKNGFVYCFSSSLLDVGVSKPDDYSQEAIKEINERGQSGETESEVVFVRSKPEMEFTSPNVIVLQMESFFDVNRLKDIQFSENPIPNMTELMKNCGSGFLDIPVIGAGTVNSEFETLTGMNIDDFGPGEYPYETAMKKTTCETMAYNLKESGYATHAIHDHEGDFYHRNEIYPNLGFDTFTSLEYMHPTAYTAMGWAKDQVLTEEIMKALDSTERQDFVFTVSVQGHGSYPADSEADYVRYVTVSSDVITDEEYLNEISYYVNQLYEMDQFIGDLISALKERNEHSILLIYGDHLPSLDITEDMLKQGTPYQTEYVIWNNMGLCFPKQELQAYQTAAVVLKALENRNGAVNRYHQSSWAEMKNGRLSEEQYLTGLKDLEYDILYGDKICYDGENPYRTTDMKMGINPIFIQDVYESYGTVVVTGKGFTRYSEIYINDKQYTTIYCNEKMLRVPDCEISSGDVVTVWQSMLSCTEPFTYEAAAAIKAGAQEEY